MGEIGLLRMYRPHRYMGGSALFRNLIVTKALEFDVS